MQLVFKKTLNIKNDDEDKAVRKSNAESRGWWNPVLV